MASGMTAGEEPRPADRELKAMLVKLSDVSFELDEVPMRASVRLKLQQLLTHAGEGAERAVKLAREEVHAK
jgi:hypothetical protein